jgi:formate dehydrogenase maturation protein FdhE
MKMLKTLKKLDNSQKKLELVEQALNKSNLIVADQIDILFKGCKTGTKLDTSEIKGLQTLIDILLKIKENRSREMQEQIDHLRTLPEKELDALIIQYNATEGNQNELN